VKVPPKREQQVMCPKLGGEERICSGRSIMLNCLS